MNKAKKVSKFYLVKQVWVTWSDDYAQGSLWLKLFHLIIKPMII